MNNTTAIEKIKELLNPESKRWAHCVDYTRSRRDASVAIIERFDETKSYTAESTVHFGDKEPAKTFTGSFKIDYNPEEDEFYVLLNERFEAKSKCLTKKVFDHIHEVMEGTGFEVRGYLDLEDQTEWKEYWNREPKKPVPSYYSQTKTKAFQKRIAEWEAAYAEWKKEERPCIYYTGFRFNIQTAGTNAEIAAFYRDTGVTGC